MKADEKFDCGDIEGEESEPSKFTNFEYLMKKVEVLEEEISLIQDILRQKNLRLNITKEADTDLVDETFKRLESE